MSTYIICKYLLVAWETLMSHAKADKGKYLLVGETVHDTCLVVVVVRNTSLYLFIIPYISHCSKTTSHVLFILKVSCVFSPGCMCAADYTHIDEVSHWFLSKLSVQISCNSGFVMGRGYSIHVRALRFLFFLYSHSLHHHHHRPLCRFVEGDHLVQLGWFCYLFNVLNVYIIW